MRWSSLRPLGTYLAAFCVTAVGCSDDGGGGADDTGSATGAGDDGTPTGSDDGADTTGPLQPDMGLQPPTACEGSCSLRASCGESEVSCLNQCDADYATYMETGGTCVSDFEALLSCVAELSCDDLAVYEAPPTDGSAYPCQPEDDAFTTSCLLGGEPPPATCDAYCSVITECAGVAPNECDAICTMQLDFAEGLGEGCVEATTAQLDCVGTLDCPGYEAYDLQEGDFPCMAETDAVTKACGM